MERQEAVDLVAAHGWTVARVTKRGYAVQPQPLPTEGSPQGRHLCRAGSVSGMFLVEVVALLVGEQRLTDDEITDVIESIIDVLDEVTEEPSIASRRVADDVEITVSAHIDEHDEWDALARGVATMRSAFDAAGIGTARGLTPRDLRSHVVPLLPA
jgi:hypothetical protein